MRFDYRVGNSGNITVNRWGLVICFGLLFHRQLFCDSLHPVTPLPSAWCGRYSLLTIVSTEFPRCCTAPLSSTPLKSLIHLPSGPFLAAAVRGALLLLVTSSEVTDLALWWPRRIVCLVMPTNRCMPFG